MYSFVNRESLKFTSEQENKIKKLIREPWFTRLNAIANICDLNIDEKSIIENIRDYIYYNVLPYTTDFATATDRFFQNMESFIINDFPECLKVSNGKPISITKGLIPISNGHHIKNKASINSKSYTGNVGQYYAGSYIGTDHNIYISKKSMRGLPVKDENKLQADYNSILAQSFFEFFNQPVAKYYVVSNGSPLKIIITKYFLKQGEKLIHLYELNVENHELERHSDRIRTLEEGIEKKYGNIIGLRELQDLKTKVKTQYCIQEFMKLLIGPMDNNLGNTALVETKTSEASSIDINISPAYDLDISFNISEDLISRNKLEQTKTDDGENASIKAFMNEFKDVQGFKKFIEGMLGKINNSNASKEIISDAYRKTGFEFFKTQEGKKYESFLSKRFNLLKQAYRETYTQGQGNSAR